jgi:hypothetical protein
MSRVEFLKIILKMFKYIFVSLPLCLISIQGGCCYSDNRNDLKSNMQLGPTPTGVKVDSQFEVI